MKNQQNQSQLEKEKAQINISGIHQKKTNTEKTVIFKITQKIIKNK